MKSIPIRKLTPHLTSWIQHHSIVIVYNLQVSPSTLRLSSCRPLDGNQIRIQPTIPVRNGSDETLSVTFALPQDNSFRVTQNDQDVCDFELRETDELIVVMKPNCKALNEDVSKTRFIVVEFHGGGLFWVKNRNKHTIWVSNSFFYAPVHGICIIYIITSEGK